jgi:hypothetical protein
MLTECFLRTSCFLQRLLGAYRIFSTELLLPPPLNMCLRSVCCVTPASSTVDWVLTECFLWNYGFLHRLLGAYRVFSTKLLLPPRLFTRCLTNGFYGTLASATVYEVLTECYLRNSCFLQHLLGVYRVFAA